MFLISDDNIEQAIQHLESVPENEMEQFVQGIIAKQPVLLAYLMEGADEEFNEDETEAALWLFSVMLISFDNITSGIDEVTEAELETADERQNVEAELMSKMNDKEIEDYLPSFKATQPVFADFLIANILGDEEELSIFTEENQGVIFLMFQLFADVLTNSIRGKNLIISN